MKYTYACGRDLVRPGRYLIAEVQQTNPDGSVDGQPIAWRDFRAQADPDAFVAFARYTFSDWCAERGL